MSESMTKVTKSTETTVEAASGVFSVMSTSTVFASSSY